MSKLKNEEKVHDVAQKEKKREPLVEVKDMVVEFKT